MTDGELIWTLFLDQSRRTVPLALFAPGPLVLMRDKLPIVFPWAIGPTLGVLGLVAAVTGVLCGGLDAALAAVGLLGIGLTTMPPGLVWLHDLPGIHLVLPRYGWVLIALLLTQAAGRGMAALGVPAGRRRAVVALGLVLAGFASLALVRDSWPVNYGSELHRVLGTSEGRLRLLVPPALTVAVVACVLRAPRWGQRAFMLLAALEAVLTVGPTDTSSLHVPERRLAPSMAIRRCLQSMRTSGS